MSMTKLNVFEQNEQHVNFTKTIVR